MSRSMDVTCLHVGPLGGDPDDEAVSFTVSVDLCLVWLLRGLGLGGGSWGQGLHLRQQVRCADGSSVKDHRVSDVQLESLILAQNERWRQA